ncbi:protein of unknown function [Georgfuchsia toluolica]|uniref:Hemerythrin-like domain-containing protein n=1 Tax=Georgfuchsia toluolica TaxID=424218 RepID=A0A916J3M0_9PROT|nr:hemerythrin domain-containing protein [Georgfuchsia toluolica]CAG4883368.1 protein of unknown function [Georgfuchsia toluolica]
MKRCSSLAWLSRQHHVTLVLAKHAQRTGTDSTEATRQLMAHAVEIFERELEPHFHVEEETLLPSLTAAGETDRVRRTPDEHKELRCLTSRLRAGDAASLRRFGDILEAHARFEERELFAVAESVLAPAATATLLQGR